MSDTARLCGLVGAILTACLSLALSFASLAVSHKLVKALTRDFPSKHARALRVSGNSIALCFMVRAVLLFLAFALPELFADEQTSFLIKAVEYGLDLLSLALVLNLFRSLVSNAANNGKGAGNATPRDKGSSGFGSSTSATSRRSQRKSKFTGNG